MITLSEAAIVAAKKLQSDEPAYQGKAVRVYLDGKGCDGFFYGVTFDDADESDHRFDQSGLTVVVDPDTLQFVTDSTVDWVDDERGRGFLVENPHHKRFRGKFFKRKSWQEALTK
jgi:iron-sulfur cluster insertion protein